MTNHSTAAGIGFRRLEMSDLPLMFRWLNQPEVKRWYDDPSETLADVEAYFGPSITGAEPTQPFLIVLDDQPIGYIQTYRPKDYPDYWSNQNLPDGAAGIDLFIGENDVRHRGLGAPIIRAFIAQILALDPTVTEIIIDPDPVNAVAIRAYEKAGFTRLREIGPPGHCESALLMTRPVTDEG
jgi:RimJ/RimL family protein N-acetyltransferase